MERFLVVFVPVNTYVKTYAERLMTFVQVQKALR
jgi:hypothetical protein